MPMFARRFATIALVLQLGTEMASAQAPLSTSDSSPSNVVPANGTESTPAEPEASTSAPPSDSSNALPGLDAVPDVRQARDLLAEPNPPAPEYLDLVGRALAEYNAGNYAEARGLLARAHARYPNARTLRGLGVVEFELRHYALSVGYLEGALASNARRLEGPLRVEVESLLERAHGYVARITLDVQPSGLSAPQLSVNGIPTDMPKDRTLLLDVGDHFISLKAPGYSEARRAVSVFGGETSRLRVELLPEAQDAQRTPLYKKWWFWASVGVVALGVSAAITVPLVKNREEQKPIEGNYPPAEVVQVLRAR